MVVGEGRGGGFSGGLVFGVRFRFFFPVCFSFLFLVFCGGNVVVVVLLGVLSRCAIICSLLFSLSLCVPRTRRSAFLLSFLFACPSIYSFIPVRLVALVSCRCTCFPFSLRAPPDCHASSILLSLHAAEPNTYIHTCIHT